MTSRERRTREDELFGAAVRRHRLERGLSQERLAEAAGLSQRYLSVLERGEIALARVEGSTARLTRFRLGPRRVRHRRHIRKYTEGELPPDRSFYFRGSDGRLNLRAANLVRFRELAEGVDEATWAHHAGRGDVSAWIRDEIKDPELADEIAVLERTAASAAESRARVLDILRRRYAV